MSEFEAEIRKFLTEQFLFGEPRALERDASLFDQGIVDSTGILELIGYLEERFGIKVQDTELLPENLDTIGNICAFLARKVEGRG
ncbi:MAG: acyl carrier protein [Acidobacteria bacterium]|nr:acyl carrier protein [Acidobacteriota bacterium]